MQVPATRQTADRDILIEAHFDMAVGMARRMARRLPNSVGSEEIESAALLGLTEAAERYDDSRQEPFMGFAAKRIRGAILDHLRRNDMLTRRGRRAARQVTEVTRALEAEKGRAVTTSEIAAHLGLSEDEFHDSYDQVREVGMVSLSELGTVPQSAQGITPVEYIERQQLRAAVVRAVAKLNERDQLILACYYQEGLTLREIGELLGITESRVSQLHGRILTVLRAELS
ncbi:sigma-70 family RNA polymerase sigma factor [Haliangium sp.]|uniref:sigma-70 family RNA polymerase sigma factor n=1 Tax=Haliangium sp. TaxID=2663208 RepID=UPI003D11BBA7